MTTTNQKPEIRIDFCAMTRWGNLTFKIDQSLARNNLGMHTSDSRPIPWLWNANGPISPNFRDLPDLGELVNQIRIPKIHHRILLRLTIVSCDSVENLSLIRPNYKIAAPASKKKRSNLASSI